MKETKWKSSMFNVAVKKDGEMILYNSYQGLKGICKVSKEHEKEVQECLATPNEADESEVFKTLVDEGYIVDVNTDEKANRERLLYEYTMDDTLHLMVHTTDGCNFRCKYCALDFKTNFITQETQDGIIQYVRKNIKKYSKVMVDWFGGEPLMGMKAIEYISKELIKICKEAKVPYVGSITTNGYLLTPENVKKLIDYHVYYYTVTIDGLKESHDNQRVFIDDGPTFDVIMKNLEYIRDNVKNRYVSVAIRSNFTADMFAQKEDYYRMLDEKFGKDGRFKMLLRPAGDWGGERVNQIRDKLVPTGKMSDLYEFMTNVEGDLKAWINIAELSTCGATCRSVKKNRYVISVFGKIQKCETCNKNYEIGYLTSDGVMHIDTNIENKWTLGYRMTCRSECDDCPISCSCLMGTCPKNVIETDRKSCGHTVGFEGMIAMAAKALEVKVI